MDEGSAQATNLTIVIIEEEYCSLSITKTFKYFVTFS